MDQQQYSEFEDMPVSPYSYVILECKGKCGDWVVFDHFDSEFSSEEETYSCPTCAGNLLGGTK